MGVPRKLILFIGAIVGAIGCEFMAPETFIKLPVSLWPMIVGICLVGIGSGMSILPFIPEMISFIIPLYPT